jgi:hypothetical protein
MELCKKQSHANVSLKGIYLSDYCIDGLALSVIWLDGNHNGREICEKNFILTLLNFSERIRIENILVLGICGDFLRMDLI